MLPVVAPGHRRPARLRDDPAEVTSLGEKAVETLHRAVAAGLQDAAFMRRDADLDPLRSRPDFQMLMMDLAFPDEPFAP